MPISLIPSFLLYGEELGETPANFAHIETIATRSALHDWEIEPHRHLQSVQALLVFRGQLEFRCDAVVSRLGAPCFMTVPIGSVHGFRVSPDTAGYVLSLSAHFATRASGPEDPMLRLLTRGGSGAIPESVMTRAEWLCAELLSVQGDWHAPQPLFLALAEALLRSLYQSDARSDEGPTHDERLARFRHLIELHMREHRRIAWYARQLATTEKTLTRACRQRLGCTPSHLIHARLTLEAQRLLYFTNASVVQVAEDLGFSDPSYFSRFYRRMTGRRPLADKSGGRAPA